MQVLATVSLRKVLQHNPVHRDADAFKLPPALGFVTQVHRNVPKFRPLKAFIWRQLLVCAHFPYVGQNPSAIEKHSCQQYTLKLIKFGSEAAGSSLVIEHRALSKGRPGSDNLGSFAHRISGAGS